MKVITLIEIPDTNSITFEHKKLFDQYGFQYEFWDVRFFSKQEKSKSISNPYTDVPVRRFENKDELIAAIRSQQQCIFITGYVISSWNRFIYQAFKTYKKPYLVLSSIMHYQMAIEPFFRLFTVKNGFFNSTVHFLYQKFMTVYNRFSSDLSKPEFSFIGNKYDMWRYNFPIPKRGLTFTHVLEYERLLPYMGKEKDGKLIVFIDQYLPYHNETQGNTRWSMKAETYYPKINDFMLQLRSLTGLDVAIATHPKAEKGKLEQFIKDIPVHYGKTNELVTNCTFAVMHNSAAINLCILQHKPFMIVMCEEIERSPVAFLLRRLSKKIRKPVFDLDRDKISKAADLDRFLEIREDSYEQYKEDNIKKRNTPERSTWEIIAEQINNLSLKTAQATL